MKHESTNEPVTKVTDFDLMGTPIEHWYRKDIPIGSLLYLHPQAVTTLHDQKKDDSPKDEVFRMEHALRLALEALKRTGNIKGPAHDREQIAITLIEQALENK